MTFTFHVVRSTQLNSVPQQKEIQMKTIVCDPSEDGIQKIRNVVAEIAPDKESEIFFTKTSDELLSEVSKKGPVLIVSAPDYITYDKYGHPKKITGSGIAKKAYIINHEVLFFIYTNVSGKGKYVDGYISKTGAPSLEGKYPVVVKILTDDLNGMSASAIRTRYPQIECFVNCCNPKYTKNTSLNAA